MTPYYKDPEIRAQIDDVLEANHIAVAYLGCDSTKTEREAVKLEERKSLRAIKHLDPEFIGRLITESDK